MTKINLTASDVNRIKWWRPGSKSFLDACRNAGFSSPKENKIDYKIRRKFYDLKKKIKVKKTEKLLS
tara:strand:- start:101 stop:301 length:201 start_codon:yes stop_codon:yes gene_type:complete